MFDLNLGMFMYLLGFGDMYQQRVFSAFVRLYNEILSS